MRLIVSADGGFATIFIGEIYSFRELCAVLEPSEPIAGCPSSPCWVW